MSVYAIWIPGIPRAWARPSAKGHRTRPADARWRNHVRATWAERFGVLDLRGPVALTAVFVGARETCDLSNLVKAIEDALQYDRADGLAPAWRDDNHVRPYEYIDAIPTASPCDAGVFLCARV